MSGKQNKYEFAFKDFLEGVKYKDIAKKYGVSVSTVKSWRSRYWEDMIKEKGLKNVSEKVAKLQKNREKTLRNKIRDDLYEQLGTNSIIHAHFMDLVEDYMSLWDIKNKLIADIKNRGVSVLGANGFLKKNDSINELNKTNTQMLKILNELHLKVVVEEDDADDDSDV
ncbi:helix-turn-helix domain-containing protein [Bacillus thuringiensis]|uniref:helix-turn-helix domain-containing protein n=1 Tax=Bacillus thuringiensis TaxID=1428 RepID=UPI000A38A012|nr:helix-turn-helix domain-containing protein [Bacillus thuringiensis]MED2129044.1 helix-turn-helix domain-containing protein [Bacillus thuringiensis]MED2151317.1 helix-turn-helix domain-containing protein [Bacillus thuringiensis]MED2172611.1 helix-turn-helix domain-containing protein [Bacillus thuringiensis]MED2479316.1 helix-turn-helix domain-containing protein [Bacillus thuringiensis]MED2653602.1 helix-turn-helix domain-containing protein [Bacillus thuringiensis]